MSLRITEHPILDFSGRRKITFYFNGERITGYSGDSIAAALHANGVKKLSESLKLRHPRGFFCGIGKCSSCLMKVNGIPNIRTCIAPIKEGLQVETQDRLAPWPEINEDYWERSMRIDTDILVVGAGPAGLCASIE
ncbi:MAG TPA: sarcosine oxidase subunit alpha, partial [Thermoplasmatales archaeon]|nr:sarcosine oxidase subunit alpha [Thermoplasmatales archaeon]